MFLVAGPFTLKFAAFILKFHRLLHAEALREESPGRSGAARLDVLVQGLLAIA